LNPLAGSNSNQGSQVAIQRSVSGNIRLTFSTDITNKVSVPVLRDENGGYGNDVHYHKVF